MKNMIKNHRPPAAMTPEPTRLRASSSDAARMLEAYAKETRVGERDGLSSWFRFQSRLNAALDTGCAPWSRRRGRRARFASCLLTAALGLAVLVNVVPSPRAAEGQGGVGSGVGSGGASGSGEIGGSAPGVGGMEGAGGNAKPTG